MSLHQRGDLSAEQAAGRSTDAGASRSKETAGELHFRVLGEIAVYRRGRRVPLGSIQQRRLLGLLLARTGETVPVDRITDVLWSSGDEPDIPERTIQSYVSRLRGALGRERVVRRTGGYAIDLGGASLDAEEFTRLVRVAHGRPPAETISRLDAALALWNGSAFGEFADEEWAGAPGRRLHELRLSAQEDVFGARIELGAHREIIGELESAVREHPTRTLLVGHLMVAFVRSGSPADALRTFQRHRRHVADESGLDPAPVLVALERQILANDPQMSLGPPRQIRGYELTDPIGAGTIGTVYRGRQPVTDRLVAVKAVGGRLADDGEFIRGFEVRAQRIARLEHPCIVALYDFWREPGGAFLVSRLLTGGSLAQLRDEPWDLQRASLLVHQIGSALAAAHRVGLVHGSVHDGNVLFDDDRNAYLADFPVCNLLGDEHARPERDCAELAQLVSSVLLGHALREDERCDLLGTFTSLRPDVPPVLVELLAATIAGTPHATGAAGADAELFVHGWKSACTPVGVALVEVAEWTGDNPYKGLRPFEESDAGDFFGRDAIVDVLHRKSAEQRLIAVIGPSGSGKSSMVLAGLLPRLRAAGWRIVLMKPGEHPVGSLRTALALAGVSAEPPTNPAEPCVVVVDQLEELYTTCTDDDERTQFLYDLAQLLAENHPVRCVITTLRADFLARPLQDRVLGPLLQDNTVIIPTMSAAELEACIRGPAARHGIGLESVLVTQLVADVNARPGSLPLLQFALTELFERRASSVLTFTEYDSTGGIGGAVSRWAESLYATLDPTQQLQMKALMARLVATTEGQPNTTRRVPLREIPTGSRSLVALLVDRRLLTVTHDPATRQPFVELAHDALISEWPRIGGWLDETQNNLRVMREIGVAARSWEAGGCDDADLYRGIRLLAAIDWREREEDSLTPSEHRFIEQSDLERRRITDQQLRSFRHVRRLSIGLATLLVVAIVAAVTAGAQRSRAERAGYESETKRLFASAAKLGSEDPAVALLLAVEGSRRRGNPIDADDALLQVLTAQPSSLGAASLPKPIRRIVSSRDGRRVVGVGDGFVVGVDATTHHVIAHRRIDAQQTVSPTIVVGPGATVIVASGDSDLLVLDDTSLDNRGPAIQLDGVARTVAASAGGTTVAVGGDFGSVQLLDVALRVSVGRIDLPSRAVALAFGHADTEVIAGEQSAVSMHDIRTKKETARFPVDGALNGLLFDSVDDTILLDSTITGGTISVAALRAGSGIYPWRISAQGPEPPALSADGPGHFLMFDSAGVTRVDSRTGVGKHVLAKAARTGTVISDGSSIVVAGETAELTFWSTVDHGLLNTSIDIPTESCSLEASSDGRWLACSSPLRVWDMAGPPQRLKVLEEAGRGFLLDHDRLLVAGLTGEWKIVMLPSGNTIERGKSSRIVGRGPTDASPDGRWLATADRATLWVVDIRRNIATVLLSPGSAWTAEQSIQDVWFSEDGSSLLAELESGDVRMWRVGRWTSRNAQWFDGAITKRRALTRTDSAGAVLSDTTTGEGSLRLVDRLTGRVLPERFVGSRSAVASAAFDPGGIWLATSEVGGSVRIWQTRTGHPIGPPIPNSSVHRPFFLPGRSRRLVTVSADTAHMWNLNSHTWVDVACHAAGRNFTRAEWQQLGPRGAAYRPTCAKWPLA